MLYNTQLFILSNIGVIMYEVFHNELQLTYQNPKEGRHRQYVLLQRVYHHLLSLSGHVVCPLSDDLLITTSVAPGLDLISANH